MVITNGPGTRVSSHEITGISTNAGPCSSRNNRPMLIGSWCWTGPSHMVKEKQVPRKANMPDHGDDRGDGNWSRSRNRRQLQQRVLHAQSRSPRTQPAARHRRRGGDHRDVAPADLRSLHQAEQHQDQAQGEGDPGPRDPSGVPDELGLRRPARQQRRRRRPATTTTPYDRARHRRRRTSPPSRGDSADRRTESRPRPRWRGPAAAESPSPRRQCQRRGVHGAGAESVDGRADPHGLHGRRNRADQRTDHATVRRRRG